MHISMYNVVYVCNTSANTNTNTNTNTDIDTNADYTIGVQCFFMNTNTNANTYIDTNYRLYNCGAMCF